MRAEYQTPELEVVFFETEDSVMVNLGSGFDGDDYDPYRYGEDIYES